MPGDLQALDRMAKEIDHAGARTQSLHTSTAFAPLIRYLRKNALGLISTEQGWTTRLWQLDTFSQLFDSSPVVAEAVTSMSLLPTLLPFDRCFVADTDGRPFVSNEVTRQLATATVSIYSSSLGTDATAMCHGLHVLVANAPTTAVIRDVLLVLVALALPLVVQVGQHPLDVVQSWLLATARLLTYYKICGCFLRSCPNLKDILFLADSGPATSDLVHVRERFIRRRAFQGMPLPSIGTLHLKPVPVILMCGSLKTLGNNALFHVAGAMALSGYPAEYDKLVVGLGASSCSGGRHATCRSLPLRATSTLEARFSFNAVPESLCLLSALSGVANLKLTFVECRRYHDIAFPLFFALWHPHHLVIDHNGEDIARLSFDTDSLPFLPPLQTLAMHHVDLFYPVLQRLLGVLAGTLIKKVSFENSVLWVGDYMDDQYLSLESRGVVDLLSQIPRLASVNLGRWCWLEEGARIYEIDTWSDGSGVGVQYEGARNTLDEEEQQDDSTEGPARFPLHPPFPFPATASPQFGGSFVSVETST
mgnify:FL=1|jgi:hypothetical protein